MGAAVRVENDGAVRRLVLCRPDELNTITVTLRDELDMVPAPDRRTACRDHLARRATRLRLRARNRAPAAQPWPPSTVGDVVLGGRCTSARPSREDLDRPTRRWALGTIAFATARWRLATITRTSRSAPHSCDPDGGSAGCATVVHDLELGLRPLPFSTGALTGGMPVLKATTPSRRVAHLAAGGGSAISTRPDMAVTIMAATIATP